MNSKPIIFSTPMIQAILARKKSQTRRVINPQPIPWAKANKCLEWRGNNETTVYASADGMIADCPYGQPGDQLWLRETWDLRYWKDGGHDYREWHGQLPRFLPPGWSIDYRAGWQNDDPELYQWRPSIFMPRWASRINLLIKNVRVERLQEISEADAIAEGIEIPSVLLTGSTYPNLSYEIDGPSTIVDYYHQLWDTINAERKVLKPKSWKLWTWGKTPSDDPEAIGLDIASPGSIQWRNTNDIDLPEWVNFDLSAPPDSGYYDVIWEPGDDPVHIYLSRSEPEQSDYIHPYSWASNPWVWVIEFEVIKGD